jgi:hypothetical protein
MLHSHIPNVQCGQLFIPIFAKWVRNLAVVSLTDPRKYGEFVITPALMMGMEEVIVDRISFGGVKELNQSQNSLPENPHQGDHEAGDGQKGNVGCRVAVIPGDQSPPVV